MDNNEKANLYDQYVREANRLQSEITSLKAKYVLNIPEEIQKKINFNNQRINELEKKLINLYK